MYFHKIHNWLITFTLIVGVLSFQTSNSTYNEFNLKTELVHSKKQSSVLVFKFCSKESNSKQFLETFKNFEFLSFIIQHSNSYKQTEFIQSQLVLSFKQTQLLNKLTEITNNTSSTSHHLA